MSCSYCAAVRQCLQHEDRHKYYVVHSTVASDEKIESLLLIEGST
jgi:hypothetical protein